MRDFDREEDIERAEAREAQRNADHDMDAQRGLPPARRSAGRSPTPVDRPAPPNPYADRHRMVKAVKLADHLAPIATVADVERMDDHDWRITCEIAGVNHASVETRTLVLSLLRQREEASALARERSEELRRENERLKADPFARFPED